MTAPAEPRVAAVCRRFGLGPPLGVETAGGTRTKSFLVRTESGRWFARERFPGYSDPARVRFDHEAVAFLARAGAAAVPPAPAPDGRTFCFIAGACWEVYPEVAGRPLRDGEARDLAALAGALGRLHRAGRRFALRFDKNGPRGELDPALIRARIGAIRRASPEISPLLAAYERPALRAAGELDDRAHGALPRTLVHGDVQPGNIIMSGGKVAAFVDFDWCARRPRVYDLAFALLTCCAGHAEPVAGGGILALTQAPVFERGAVQAFLEGYQAAAGRFSGAEARALPPMLMLAWCHNRVSGALKVPARERGFFLGRGPEPDFGPVLGCPALRPRAGDDNHEKETV